MTGLASPDLGSFLYATPDEEPSYRPRVAAQPRRLLGQIADLLAGFEGRSERTRRSDFRLRILGGFV